MNVQFFHDAFPVRFNGAHTDAQVPGDFFVALTLCNQCQHFAFTRGKLDERLLFSTTRDKLSQRGLGNLRVVTQDVNLFTPDTRFDRVVSVEMFEHIVNWRELMTRVAAWLTPDGHFFLHIFTHRSGAYLCDRADGEDWIAQPLLSGGVMPSHHLIRQYADLFAVEKEWRWSGVHYQRTAQDWLANFDSRHDEIERVLRKVHGGETALWMRRWRWFLLATSGLFGYADGSEWGVSHYRLKAA